jgi:fengycin family lipopeptide synthetase D
MSQKDFSIKIAAADTRKTKERDYWMKRLSADGGPVKSRFPYDFDYKSDNSDIGSVEFKKVYFRLSAHQFSMVMKLAGDSNVKLYILLAAMLNLLLDKYMYTDNHPGDSERDIVIGTPISRQEDEKNLINTVLPIRNRFNHGMPVKELLMQVRETIIGAAEHRNYPVELLPEQLGLANSGPGFPLFDIILLLENIHDKRYIEHIPVNIIFSFRRASGAVEGFVEYNPLVYRQDTMEQVVKRFKRLMANALDGLDKPLRDVEMVSEEEKRQVLVEFNRTAAPYPADKTLHRLFAEQMEQTPDHIAVISRVHVTYRELNEKSNQLAQYLFHEKNIQPDERVGVLMESSPDLAVAIMGILKAGAAYLPIDPSLPGERMKTIIHDASVGVVLSQKKYLRILNRLQWECDSFHTYLCMDTRDIYGEEEEETSPLMDKTLWEYVGKSAADDIEGGGWLSSYTGEPFSGEEMAEYGDNVLKKLAPFLHPQMRVLEIGCASGITMYRIAPGVGFYYGTDLSQVIIEKNKKKIEQEGHQNIKLSGVAAHEIGRLGENNFDLVIMNSVIQCFHGHHYLGKVIRTCIDLMGEEGYLFIGDIMDQQLKEALIREMIEFKRARRGRGKNYKTKIDFSEELFISRAFFADLAVDLPVIKEIHFSRKIYTVENELTKFRYDVLITIDKKQRRNDTTGGRKECRHKYRQDARAIEFYDRVDVHCRVKPGNLAYVIYTSGSTGKPKGVMVEHRGVVNTLFYRKAVYRMGASVRALQLFSYAFDGFVTAFFTPLLSGAAVILPGGEEGKDILKIKEAIFSSGVGHFISVPALFRVIMGALTPEQAASLKVVALAGDKLTPDLLDLAAKKNKELEIVNEYGVTEAAVMSTLYRHQERDKIIKIGFPIGNTRIYILGSGKRPQPVGIYGELCISGAGLARGYLNNPELTAEKFDPDLWDYQTFFGGSRGAILQKSPPGRRRHYRTGDMARWSVDGAIEFGGRIDAQVKIRGFRIETGEIETLLRTHEDVSEALVAAVEIDVGERSLCAYIVPYAGYSPDTADLKAYLSRQLPDYMIPVYFVFIEKIPFTAAGKVDRRALPKPGTLRRQRGIAPRDEVERKLAELWCRVLGIDEAQGVVGIDDNFFELGGHSLRATALTAGIHKEMNVEVPLVEVFKSPYIRELSRYIREASRTRYAPIEPVEKREYYPLSPAQQRFYMIQRMTPGTTAYNMPQVIPLGPDADKKRIETVFRRLIESHESLRTAFITVDDKPVQGIYDEVEFAIEFYNLATGATEGTEGTEEEKKKIQNSFIRPFDLSRPPLLRVGLVETPGGDSLLLVDMHHIISDGTSQMVLAGNFVSLYKGEALESIRLQYRDFSQWQNRRLETESGRMKADRVFWLDHLAGKLPVLNIPTDFPRPRERGYAGESFSGSLGRELSRQVSRLSRQTDTTLYMVLLTALNILLSRYTGQEDIIIGSPAAGRNHADLEKVIGLVLGTILMRNFPSAEKSFREFLQEVRARTLAAYEHHAYPFEELLKKLDYREDPARNAVSDVALIVQNMFPAAPAESAPGVPGVSKLDFTIHALEQGEEIIFIVEYRTALFRRSTMERLTAHLGNILKESLKNPGIHLGEIDMISSREKREVMGIEAPCFPLSHPQKRIYYTEKRYPYTSACNLAFTVRYNRLLDRGLLEEAINRVLRRNEGLWLRIVEFDYPGGSGSWAFRRFNGVDSPASPRTFRLDQP